MSDVDVDELEREVGRRASAALVPGDFWVVAAELLRPTSIEKLRRYPVDSPATDDRSLLTAAAWLANVGNVLEKLGAYGREKLDDRFGRPMEALTCVTLHEAFRAWCALRARLPSEASEPGALEWRLLNQIVRTWSEVFDYERNHELLRDFAELVGELLQEESAPVVSAREAEARLSRSEQSMALVLRNLLIRLVLFSSPRRAALVYRTVRSQHTVAYWLDRSSSSGATLVESDGTQWPEWLDAEWSNPSMLASLTKETITTVAKRSEGEHRLIEIPAGETDMGMLGFILLTWNASDGDVRRFDNALPIWMACVQAFLLKREMTRQHTVAGRVFSMVAHNLGSPLFHLASDAQVLSNGFLEDEPERRFEKYGQILRETRHMQGIVDAILSIDERQPRLNLKEISLAQIVHEAVRAVRADSHVRIEYVRPDDERLQASMIFTDETRVYDIVLNLMTNAIKYSPERGVVRVRTSMKPHGAEIVVSDEGPGIPDSERSKIFAPFFRGRSTEGNVPGLGLGLYVVDLYTKALQGRVKVLSNRPLPGTSFHIYLPRLTPGESS